MPALTSIWTFVFHLFVYLRGAIGAAHFYSYGDSVKPTTVAKLKNNDD
jgi:hypothetical protein